MRLGERRSHGGFRNVVEGTAEDHPVGRTVIDGKRLRPPLGERHTGGFRRFAIAFGLDRVWLDAEHSGAALGERSRKGAASAAHVDQRPPAYPHEPVQHRKIGALSPVFDRTGHDARIALVPPPGQHRTSLVAIDAVHSYQS